MLGQSFQALVVDDQEVQLVSEHEDCHDKQRSASVQYDNEGSLSTKD